MRDRDIIVSKGVDKFLEACLDSVCCLKCGKQFKAGSDTANVAQVHKFKVTTTLTGGVLCEPCSGKFVRWIQRK